MRLIENYYHNISGSNRYCNYSSSTNSSDNSSSNNSSSGTIAGLKG